MSELTVTVTDAATGEKGTKKGTFTVDKPLFGMAVGPVSGAISDDLNNFKAVVAANPHLGVTIRRSYRPGTVATYTEALPGAGVLPFFSQKPDLGQMASGSLDSWATTFAKSCPDGAYLTIQHEPDNPNKGISAASFVAGFNRWAKVTKQANPKVLVGPVFMEWQMRIQGANYGYANVDPSLIDFWGFDAYVTNAPAQGYSPNDTCQQLCERTAIPTLKAKRDLPFVVAEVGISFKQAPGANRSAWLTAGRAWAPKAKTVLLYYEVSEWMLSDAELKAVV